LSGALSIGRFVVSRWRLRRTRDYGIEWQVWVVSEMETLGFGPNPRWRLLQDQVLQRLGTGRSGDKTCWWLITDLRGIPGVLRFDIIPGMRDVLVLFHAICPITSRHPRMRRKSMLRPLWVWTIAFFPTAI